MAWLASRAFRFGLGATRFRRLDEWPANGRSSKNEDEGRRAMSDERRSFTDEEALASHREPTPGKIAVAATKPMATQRDLSLAYSPGVAVPVLRIAEEPDAAYDYTSKGN